MDLSLRVPYGYGYNYRTLNEIRNILLQHYHPEYVRRIIPWLYSKGGLIGIGGHWRATGTQPDKSGFAPEGRSFHQNQLYRDGFMGATAVDLNIDGKGKTVHSSGAIPRSMVPWQGSTYAKQWGLHINIDSEVWHMQPVEIDGWLSWYNAGRPFPRKDYQLPVPTAPIPTPTPTPTPTAKEAVVQVTLETLRVGARSKDARRCQALLNARAREHGSKIDVVAEDGHYGAITAGIVKFVQGETGQYIDGIVGPKTWTVLLEQ